MGNCATFTKELYSEVKTCDLGTERFSADHRNPGPEPYPEQYTLPEYRIEHCNMEKGSNSLEDSVLKEDPYRNFMNQQQEKSNLRIDEVEEKVLDFKMLSVRGSLTNSVMSESFTKNKTKAEVTIQEDKENRSKMMMVSDIIDVDAEPMQPMNRDKSMISYMSPTRTSKTPLKTKEEKNILDNSSLFISPFKKYEAGITSFQQFKQNKYVPLKSVNNPFFTKTLQYLGPFDYSLKEDFLSHNPWFREFLQRIGYLPFEEPQKLENGAVYAGQWQNGQKNGKGKQTWPDGSFYEGYWYNNQAHGKGRLIHSQGTVYEGYWAFDQAHGSGLYFTIEGSCYQGGWYEDKQHGFGVEKWGSGASYEGDYFKGLKHGNGMFRWEDGSYYQGEFKQNIIQGKGKYHWNDGREYEGDWIDNKMNGKGVFKWPDGRIYSGNYEDDEKNGIGVFFWPDGSLYKGFWKNGAQEGKGKFIGSDGRVLEGVWRSGSFLG